MIGQYVRMTTAPSRMGIVVAARFDGCQGRFLFHQDPRFAGAFPDIWLLDSDLEESTRPSDAQVAAINKLAKNQYVRMAIDPNNRGTIKAARFDKGHVSYLFHRNSQFDDTFSDIWLLDSELEVRTSPPDQQRLGHMNHESAIQLTELLLGRASAKQDFDPVDDQAWADLFEVGIWAQYHSPYPRDVADAIPSYDSARTWQVVKHAAQAIVDSFTGSGASDNDVAL